MFKLLKSKKGFTLVELMIVVVIMAILVAVAVPIFSAVTKNARIKTCAANRREIISQVNGFLMGNVDGAQHTSGATFSITSDGKKGTMSAITMDGDATETYSDTAIKALFQELPYCPAKGTYSVTITKATTSGVNETTATVGITCNGGDDAGEHV